MAGLQVPAGATVRVDPGQASPSVAARAVQAAALAQRLAAMATDLAARLAPVHGTTPEPKHYRRHQQQHVSNPTSQRLCPKWQVASSSRVAACRRRLPSRRMWCCRRLTLLLLILPAVPDAAAAVADAAVADAAVAAGSVASSAAAHVAWAWPAMVADADAAATCPAAVPAPCWGPVHQRPGSARRATPAAATTHSTAPNCSHSSSRATWPAGWWRPCRQGQGQEQEQVMMCWQRRSDWLTSGDVVMCCCRTWEQARVGVGVLVCCGPQIDCMASTWIRSYIRLATCMG
jgi:hypothetical protein